MESLEVGLLLQECLEAVKRLKDHQLQKPNESVTQAYRDCRDAVPLELASLLQDAEQMQWPFVPERWQYKRPVEASDKTNLSDVIRRHLPQLLTLLKASIESGERLCALGVIFLVDRFLYWTDESTRLLKITKLLHKLHPEAPVAPQLVIRQARVYLNSGKLQRAEYILSSLISSSGTTGGWVYQRDSDRALVQAVGVQVRGMILQKLGLWLEAAELIWASLVGYYALPEPDKKGIGTSLGLLANIFVSMNDEDFKAFQANPDVSLSLLGESPHRLLCAAHVAQLAVVYSQYTSLYVLTNVVSRGTSLLSYSFSAQCPSSLRQSFLLKARQAFEVGLLTKSAAETVTSVQELHTFLKAAYSLTVTDKWLGADPAAVDQATQACKEALGVFHGYCKNQNEDKDAPCADIMHLIGKVKDLLRVEPLPNSDESSFIPDSYRDVNETPVSWNLEQFSKLMQKFTKFHATSCETERSCKSTAAEQAKFCITAMGTTAGSLSSECSTEAKPSDASLASSWLKVSLSNSPRWSSGSAAGAHMNQADVETANTEGEEAIQSLNNSYGSNSSWEKLSTGSARNKARLAEVGSKSSGSSMSLFHLEMPESLNARAGCVARSAASSNESPQSGNVRIHQADVETANTEGEEAIQSLNNSYGSNSSWEMVSTGSARNKPMLAEVGSKSSGSSTSSFHLEMSESLNAKSTTFSSASPHSGNVHVPQADVETANTEGEEAIQSLNNSYGSNSSWEKLSTGSERSKPMLANVGSRSSGSSEGLFHLEMPASLRASSKYGKPNMNGDPNAFDANQCASTEPSTDRSFEMMEHERNENQSGKAKKEERNVLKEVKNELCHSCLRGGFLTGAESHCILTESDYDALLSGVCHQCLLKRLDSDAKFQLREHQTAYSALHLKFSKTTGLWTARETCAFIGQEMGVSGSQRAALWVQFLHQEERLSSYVGKDYLKPTPIEVHLNDVERQMTAQYYVTEFNKSLYERDEMAQIFFIPSEALLILEGERVVGCVSVEPYMLGRFVKLTNNTWKRETRGLKATEYGLAFGHFTYVVSGGQEVVVDLQGWVTANGKGLTYLTDPQIHSSQTPRGPSNLFAERGLRYFLEEQHGPRCNEICRLLRLPPVTRPSPLVPL